MPVLPLVGSISSRPGFRRPRRSASQIMAAPMRHFTEYAGLRPSIFAMTLACAPSVTRLRRISGVRPMLNELSGKIMNSLYRSDLPVCHVAGLRFLPVSRELRESGVIQDSGHGRVHLLPDLV